MPADRASFLLALGALAGLVIAAAGLLSGSGAGVPAGAVAQVGDQSISREEYERSIAALAADRREPLGDADRKTVLERMIDEELLLQRGLELGLARSDRRLRSAIVQSVVSAAVAEAGDAPPSEETLRRFYEEHENEFRGEPSLRVRQVLVRVGADEKIALERAAMAVERLRGGEDFDRVKTELGDVESPRLPDQWLGAQKLVDYLGPTAARRALELAPGEVGAPVRAAEGLRVLQVLERRDGQALDFETARTQVQAEFQRRAGEEALARYLADLRRRTHVVEHAD